MNTDERDDVVILKKSEFIKLLVYSYLQGVETVKEAVANIPLHEEKLIAMFELKLSNRQDIIKN